MSSDILAKLKIKNLPTTKEKIEINIPIPVKKNDINLKTTVVDKSSSSNFDREAFLKTIIERNIGEIRKPTNISQAVPPVIVAQPIPTEQTIMIKPKPKLKPKVKLNIVDDFMDSVKADALPSDTIQIKKKKPKLKITDDIIEPVVPVPAAPVPAAPVPAAPVPAVSAPAVPVPAAPVPAAPVPVPAAPAAENVLIKKVVKRKTIAPSAGLVYEGPLSQIKIGDAAISERILPKAPAINISASSYYMNNREIFTNFMSSLFGKYKQELLTESNGATCDYDPDAPFSLMTHQKIVRDYLNLYTPYRGLLLFHGLGSGKTCSFIAIAEGMKNDKKIIVMTPKSLRMNSLEELKKCGDELYNKNQFWEFISTKDEPELIEPLSKVLSLSMEFIRNSGGAWLVNMKKKSNFDTLNSAEKKSLNTQLNEMIGQKYTFISYNGMRKSHLDVLSKSGTINPFDNAVIIIDEAHNFVSRIVNKLNKTDTLSGRLYEYLMNANNAKIVLLSGTPIINYPNEIAVLFNILRGKIKTWTLKLAVSNDQKVSQAFFQDIFKSTILGGNIMDFLEYKATSTTLVITRNPFGFVNKTEKEEYKGVRIGERGDIDDETFISLVTKILYKNNIKVVPGSVKYESYKALPDKLDDFKAYFINDVNKEVKNMNLFKRRILGLSSYFRSAQESLMPRYNKSQDLHIIKIIMSDFQFGIYEEARIEERKLEKKNKKKKKTKKATDTEESVSTYRIFSRAFCNFVFPRPDIRRPMPKDGDLVSSISAEIDEDVLDALTNEEKIENIDGRYEADELAEEEQGQTGMQGETDGVKVKDKIVYDKNINAALKQLADNKDKYLSPTALETYSPKFLNILENVKDIDHEGLHLVYSQFRTLEGVGIMKLVFEANGFIQFKIKKIGESWQLNMTDEDLANPNKFALYTGTETDEEKELIRNIFNGDWKYIPLGIETKLKTLALNNMYGEVIKVLMISASGAEGISLKNVRYVHITEPYWHPVRMEQVIGRARRICSHKDLPEELRTVNVFLYLMTFSQKQLESDKSIEMRLQDVSKLDGKTPMTSDEALYEIATIKENINMNILLAVKEASFDCALHSKVGSSEKLKCFTFGTLNTNKFSYYPSIAEEEMDDVIEKNKGVRVSSVTDFKWIDGVTYKYNKDNGEVYDMESYKLGNPQIVGKLEVIGTGKDAQYKFEKI